MTYYENLYLEIDTILEFGKYQGETVGDVLEDDPEYLKWLAEQGVDMNEEVLNGL